jgi:ABC-type lipoprotein export system ATPase subunit
VRTIDFRQLVETKAIGEILAQYPVARDFFVNFNLADLPQNFPLAVALERVDEARFVDFGFTRADVVDQFVLFLETLIERNKVHDKVDSITILGGQDKQGTPEDVNLTIHAGQIISIVGSTGSGKSQLLSDIECIAQRDTPTKRQILVNGKALNDEARFKIGGKLVAQLSQNMNFVMDLSVAEFLEMHAKSRMCENSKQVIRQCFACANELAGEKFTAETKVTQLSGGQSRALMIASTAHISASPIVLIDEIENAGVDRKQAIRLLAKKEKIVLISTHDPLLALNADKRIVIKNGGIYKIIKTSTQERKTLSRIEALDSTLQEIRHQLRMGNLIEINNIMEGKT